MRSQLQITLIEALAGILRPIISLCLRCGIGFTEFRAISRETFISVAAEEYGLRGRPTNISRIAAMTGISRKEIKRVRDSDRESRWTPAMEISPANLIIHFWHFDKDFVDEKGDPKPLPLEGDISFSKLARRYAGDIPVGALKEELKNAGVISDSNGRLCVRRRYFHREDFDEDFIRNISFSLKNLATTVVHNAQLARRKDFNQAVNEEEGRFERFAWSDRLSNTARREFRKWVRTEGARFVEDADQWIGENEVECYSWDRRNAKSVGVGLYFFEED